MKIIFATGIPFIEQHKIDMYVSNIETLGETELWDLSEIYGRSEDNVTDIVRNRVIIKNVNDLDNQLMRFGNGKKILFITNILATYLNAIYSVLKERNVVVININKEGMAAWLSYRAELKIAKQKGISDKTVARIKNTRFFRTIYKRIRFGSAKYDYQFSSFNFFPEDSKNFIKIHNIKFDEYVNAKQGKSLLNGPYILFVDAGLPDHPMYANKENRLNRDLYMKQMNHYFSRLEEDYAMPVVISAHPKSLYSKEDFNNRVIIKYRTPELLEHCDYVISHYSTSLVNAVLLKKPIKILISSDILKSATKPAAFMAIEFAALLKLDVVNLDKMKHEPFTLDKDEYDQFLRNYILDNKNIRLTNAELLKGYLEDIYKGAI